MTSAVQPSGPIPRFSQGSGPWPKTTPESEYKAICDWMTKHGVLNAPMSERARELLHHLRADNEQLRAAVDAAREFDAHVDGCWTTEQTHLIAAAAQAKFRSAVRALDTKS